MGFGPKCPICKQELSIEMLAIGTEKGEKKRKPKFGAILSQIISYAIESTIRAQIGNGRSLYYTCNNAECPLCYSMTKPRYLKNTPFGPQLVGDPAGLIIMILSAQYKRKKRKNGGGKAE